jgi:UDP-2,4-diacetamido-2,4,6-trideoxy-beta-L-altropyranose hydrolase
LSRNKVMTSQGSARRTTARWSAVIRADAGVAIGGGHVRRCLVLAEALADAKWNVTFASQPGSHDAVPLLGRGAFAQISLEEGDEVTRLRDSVPAGCDLFVVDQYGLDADFERACRGWAKRILVIDDLADRQHDCDILVDQTPGRDASDYISLVPQHCRVLAGPAYALLDRRFQALRAQRRAAERVGQVLVSFGSTDSADMTSAALSAVRIARLSTEVVVVLGGSSPHLGHVREVAASLCPPAEIHVDVDDMAGAIVAADLAIGAGGVSSLERCCLGLPSLLIVVADNQRGNADALARAGAAVIVGSSADASPARIASALRELAENPARRQAMSEAAFAVCDGGGAFRVVNALD